VLDLQGLHIRAALFRYIRTFFTHRGFLEVDTPLRQPVIIPECNIVPILADGNYLQTSPELCMKRLLAAGCRKIFQICPCFRKDEMGRNHLEEFTMLEWYRTGATYQQLMLDCEELLHHVAAQCVEHDQQLHPGVIDIPAAKRLMVAPAERLTVAEAFERFAPLTVDEALSQEKFEEVLVEYIEPNLGISRPLFLMDYPRELASLAKVDPLRPDIAERFELYVAGIELANGFSELTDANEQRQRFEQELETIYRIHGRKSIMPERFLGELEGIQSAAGIAFGLDRLLMLLMGKEAIGEVVAFNPGDF